MDSKFTGPKPHGYIMAGGNIGGYHKRHPKAKMIVELQEMLQMIWDSLPRGLVDKAVKKLLKWMKACFETKVEDFEHFQWL